MMLKQINQFLLYAISKIACAFSSAAAHRIGYILGLASYFIFKRRRNLAESNLHQALGEKLTTAQEKEIVKGVFAHLGITLIEFLRMATLNRDNLNDFFTFIGLEHLQKAYAAQKGILALTAHIGNWELLAAAISLSGFNTAIIAKSARQEAVNNFLVSQRQSKGVKIFSGRNMVKHILRQLKAGGIVGIVLDQSAIARDGVVVPFFGKHASTLKSLAILSQRSDAVILPMYTYREGTRHIIVIEPPIVHENETGDAEAIVHHRTLHYTQWIESAIKKHPEQWIWTHNRWKNRD